MNLHRSISEPIRTSLTWDDAWKGKDQGMISCWENGRAMAERSPELAVQASNGRLVILPWKGGVEKAIKKKEKFGTLFYLAMWQGLRGDDLNIDLDSEPSLVCVEIKMKVIFTNDYAKYSGTDAESES